MKLFKYYLLLLLVISVQGLTQTSYYPLPRDSNNFPLEQGLGPSYAGSVTVTSTSYDPVQTYIVPSSGNDGKRAYRHLYVLNRSSTRTIYVCVNDEVSCTDDAMIVRPGYAMIFEPLLFGLAVGKGYVYFKLDSAGTAPVDVAVW